MKTQPGIAVLLVCSLIAACKDTKKSIYEGCCGTAPTIDSTLVMADSIDQNGEVIYQNVMSYLYVPNIYVVNTDGQNPHSYFHVNVGIGFYKVISFLCKSPENEILYEEYNFYPDQNNYASGWSGKKPDGSYHIGLFQYQMTVEFLDGQQRTYNGETCLVHCGDGEFPSEFLPNCFFPTQENGNGEYDPNLPYPNDCFN